MEVGEEEPLVIVEAEEEAVAIVVAEGLLTVEGMEEAIVVMKVVMDTGEVKVVIRWQGLGEAEVVMKGVRVLSLVRYARF